MQASLLINDEAQNVLLVLRPTFYVLLQGSVGAFVVGCPENHLVFIAPIPNQSASCCRLVRPPPLHSRFDESHVAVPPAPGTQLPSKVLDHSELFGGLVVEDEGVDLAVGPVQPEFHYVAELSSFHFCNY